ncbi:MAG: SprT-like domain-containing protein [Thermoanaerobaculia bacterium]
MQLSFDFQPPPRPAARRRRAPSRRSPRALERLTDSWCRRLRRPRWRGTIRVRFNARMRTALGRAVHGERLLELNPRLLDAHPPELLPTLAHELCHLLAGFRAAHGPAWRELVVRLGYPADACHDLDASRFAARRRAWRWSCAACGESYLRRHRGARRFRCGRCGGKLRVDGPALSTGAAL